MGVLFAIYAGVIIYFVLVARANTKRYMGKVEEYERLVKELRLAKHKLSIYQALFEDCVENMHDDELISQWLNKVNNQVVITEKLIDQIENL